MPGRLVQLANFLYVCYLECWWAFCEIHRDLLGVVKEVGDGGVFICVHVVIHHGQLRAVGAHYSVHVQRRCGGYRGWISSSGEDQLETELMTNADTEQCTFIDYSWAYVQTEGFISIALIHMRRGP